MDIRPFSVGYLPGIEFGEGRFAEVPRLVAEFGRRVLLVTGATSFLSSRYGPWLQDALRGQGASWEIVQISEEPSPMLIDDIVRTHHRSGIEVVLGVGGGSVLDAAKAIAGLLPHGNSVMDHLEGVGPERPYRGPSTPFIAAPTTAGTGSEATRNAVLSVQGPQGFKKSFRHNLLVARYAVVDPLLLIGCPPSRIAANGMDALTQLLESLVSGNASPFTDALARSGLEAVREGLLPWYEQGDQAAFARQRMAYAALLSGITLAQAGLGSVHGLASPLGAFFPISHGVACGTLVAAATTVNIAALRERAPDSPALSRYALAARLLTGCDHSSEATAQDALVVLLQDWTARLDLPRLGACGMQPADIPRVVANCRGSSMKTNPIALTDEEVAEVLRQRL